MRGHHSAQIELTPRGGTSTFSFGLVFVQVNMLWKAFAEIYKMHSIAPFSKLNFLFFFFFEGRIRSPRGLEDIRNPSFAQAPRENASLLPALSSPSSLSQLNAP